MNQALQAVVGCIAYCKPLVGIVAVGEWNRLLNCVLFPLPSFVQLYSRLVALHPQYPPDPLEGDCGGVALEGSVQEVIVVAD